MNKSFNLIVMSTMLLIVTSTSSFANKEPKQLHLATNGWGTDCPWPWCGPTLKARGSQSGKKSPTVGPQKTRGVMQPRS